MLSRSSWLYLCAFLVVVAGLAERIWAQEIREFETRMLDTLGIPMALRVAGIAVVLSLFVYDYYVRSKREAARLGQPVIRRSVVVFTLGCVVLMLALVLYAVRG